jgi:hypothetical protein
VVDGCPEVLVVAAEAPEKGGQEGVVDRAAARLARRLQVGQGHLEGDDGAAGAFAGDERRTLGRRGSEHPLQRAGEPDAVTDHRGRAGDRTGGQRHRLAGAPDHPAGGAERLAGQAAGEE